TEIKQWCYTGPWDEVAAYARVMNVPLEADSKEIRFKMRQLAERDPARFIQGMNNKLMLRKHYILEALDMGIIKRDTDLNALLWDSGVILMAAPMGMDVVDHFVDHTTTALGEQVYEVILNKVKPKPGAKSTPAPAQTSSGSDMVTISKEELEKLKANAVTRTDALGNTYGTSDSTGTQAPVTTYQASTTTATAEVKPVLKSTGLTMKQAQDLLKECIEKNVITRKGPSGYAFDRDGKNERKFVGPGKVIEALKEEQSFLDMVKHSQSDQQSIN